MSLRTDSERPRSRDNAIQRFGLTNTQSQRHTQPYGADPPHRSQPDPYRVGRLPHEGAQEDAVRPHLARHAHGARRALCDGALVDLQPQSAVAEDLALRFQRGRDRKWAPEAATRSTDALFS